MKVPTLATAAAAAIALSSSANAQMQSSFFSNLNAGKTKIFATANALAVRPYTDNNSWNYCQSMFSAGNTCENRLNGPTAKGVDYFQKCVDFYYMTPQEMQAYVRTLRIESSQTCTQIITHMFLAYGLPDAEAAPHRAFLQDYGYSSTWTKEQLHARAVALMKGRYVMKRVGQKSAKVPVAGMKSKKLAGGAKSKGKKPSAPGAKRVKSTKTAGKVKQQKSGKAKQPKKQLKKPVQF